MPKKDIFSNPFSKIKIKEKQILPGLMHELKNVKLTLEQDFNRENHMAQIFSHLVMPGEISKESHIFQLFVRKLQRQKLRKFYLRELSFDFWAVAQYAWVAQSYN